MKIKNNILRMFRYFCLLFVIVFGLMAIIGSGSSGGNGGSDGNGDSNGNGDSDGNGGCNVEFCRQVNNYEYGYGVEGVDEIVVTCIQGPDGATVSNQMNGEYIVNGTYKLGTFDTATIDLHWGGTTSYSLYEDYEINSAGEGSFTVQVIKTSGGSGNLFLSMASGSKWMFDAVPVNTLCDSASFLSITELPEESFDYDANDDNILVREIGRAYHEK